MTRFQKLKGVNFTQTGLPTVVSYQGRIKAIPSLGAWFNGLSETCLRDGSGRLTKWLDRSAAGTSLVKNGAPATAPLYVASGYNGRPNVVFRKARGDALAWSGLRGTGSGGTTKQSVILVAALGSSDTSGQQLFSDTSPSSGWNTLYYQYNGANHRIYQSVGATGAASINIDISALAGTGVPMLIISTIDDSANTQKLRINNGTVVVGTSGSINVEAQDAYIGATSPTSGSPGVDMDLYELMPLGIDILAPENAAYLQSITEYVGVAYGIV